MTKPILLIPSGIMSAKEKKDIEDAGYLIVITDNPEKIKFITPNEESLMGLTKDKLLSGMMRVLFNAKGEEMQLYKEWLLRIMLSEMGAKKDES